MYQTKSRNVKVNALTRISNIISKDKENDRLKYQYQIILIFNRLKILVIDLIKFFVYNQMFLINKFDEECMTLRQTLSENKTTLKEILLRDCKIKNEVLYCRSRL